MRNCNKGVDTCSFLKPDETGKVQRYGYTYSLSKSGYDAILVAKYYKKVFVYKTGLQEEIETPEEVGDTDILDVSWSYKTRVPVVKLLGVWFKCDACCHKKENSIVCAWFEYVCWYNWLAAISIM